MEMNLNTKKKTCRGCKAFRFSDGSDFECLLRYKITKTSYNGLCEITPLEKCPKPKKYEDYFFANKYYKKT
jgi:hypothetical protein